MSLSAVLFRLGSSRVTFVSTVVNNYTQVRSGGSFFVGLSGEALWKSVSPNTTKKGGRGKRAKKRKVIDLGKHKVLGEGKSGMVWPGLNDRKDDRSLDYVQSPFQRTEEAQQQYLENQEEYLSKKQRHFNTMQQRGWTGAQLGGVCLGPPEGPNREIIPGFNSYVLEMRRVSHMNGKQGRVYGMRAIVAVGNGKGTFGIGMATAPNVGSAAKKAQLKALKRLQWVKRCDERTIFEDIFVTHHCTSIYFRKQPPGYGLRCHRAIMTLSKLIGIQDLHAKVVGSSTMLNLVKCFMKGIHSQKTYQEMAEESGYHIVEYDELRDNYPIVLASPKKSEVKTEPFDEYSEYLNQIIVTNLQKWNVYYEKSQGPPIPNALVLPEVFSEILNERL